MELIGEDDTGAALEAAPTSTVDALADLAIGEMHRRFDDPDLKAKIPDHALFKLIGDINKILERRAAEGDTDEPTLLEVIDIPGYPDGLKRKLLGEEIGRLEAEATSLRTRLESL